MILRFTKPKLFIIFKNMKQYQTIVQAILTIFICAFLSCKQKDASLGSLINDPKWIHKAMEQLTKTMVHDIFSPPVASRIYAYPSIAAYEALISGFPKYRSLAGQLNGLNSVPKPKQGELYNFELSAIQAFILVGGKMVFSVDELSSFEKELSSEIQRLKLPKDVVERSMNYGTEVANHILEWANKDNYKETRTAGAYDIKNTPGSWKPTPPAYMPGIEPHWSTIRPFVLDSASQFTPALPTVYSMDKESTFYKEVMEVYNTGKNLTKEQVEIAEFWDCNPFALKNKGHLMFATKKITPGGHWIGITEIVTKQSNFNFMETVHAYALVSIGIADAFISCWDEKWRSNLIRPETVISEFIDDQWKPLLQTPPFPEYTSGHSVVSGSASTILTNLLGDSFTFLDTSELDFGLPARQFNSFHEAAEEAAISRLYGGIHYMPAIKNGLAQGHKVASLHLKQIKTK